MLAQVSLKWYTWLEQGRELNFSRELLCRVSRVLRLSECEQSYLVALTHRNAAPDVTIAAGSSSDWLRRTVLFAPEDLSFIKFDEPVREGTVARLPFLASQRMLLCINELQIARLPRDGASGSFAEFERFYGDGSQVLGARIRPFLENFAFDFLCRDDARRGGAGGLVAWLEELLSRRSTFLPGATSTRASLVRIQSSMHHTSTATA